MHEGGYRIERVSDNGQRRDEQFMQQTIIKRDRVSDVERALRNSAESFDQVRRLTPERFRFRVVDRDGHAVAGHENGQNQSTCGDYSPIQITGASANTSISTLIDVYVFQVPSRTLRNNNLIGLSIYDWSLLAGKLS